MTNSNSSKISLKTYNSFQLDVSAPCVFEFDHVDALKRQIEKNGSDFILLGGGSNVLLLGDLDVPVFINRIKGIRVTSSDDKNVYITVGAGENWSDFVEYSVANNFWGLENLALIPGTVGAAPVQNIGAYGVEVESCFFSATLLDRYSCQEIIVTKQDCNFGYRESRFKSQWKDQYVILDVTFQLSRTAKPALEYPGLKDFFSADQPIISQRAIFDRVCFLRNSKLPDPRRLPNVGSFFKNPVVPKPTFVELKEKFPNIASFAFGDDFKIAAGWLIDQAGWRGKCLKTVGMHEHQALVMVNHGGAVPSDVRALYEEIQRDVLKQYGIFLEVEPTIFPTLKI